MTSFSGKPIPRGKMRDGAGSAFWSLVKRESRAVAVSRAVVVDGGLSPPPSKIYPGTKCYMVTVRVDGEEHLGFGPSPSIAQRAAILEAYKCLHSCKNGEVVKLSEAFAGDVSGSEEGGEVMSEAVSPESMPPSQTAAHLASSHYEDADSTSSLHGKRHLFQFHYDYGRTLTWRPVLYCASHHWVQCNSQMRTTSVQRQNNLVVCTVEPL